jgi:hypothetical protein
MTFLLFTVLTDISVIITKYDRNIGHFQKFHFIVVAVNRSPAQPFRYGLE